MGFDLQNPASSDRYSGEIDVHTLTFKVVPAAESPASLAKADKIRLAGTAKITCLVPAQGWIGIFCRSYFCGPCVAESAFVTVQN
jgi:hypothetical protein